MDYDKISNDNYNMGLSESVETLQEEVKELFENPYEFKIDNYCDDCKHYNEKEYPNGECIKNDKTVNELDLACEDFEWK